MPAHERGEESDDTLGKQITITCVSRARTDVRRAESRKSDEEASGGNANDRKGMLSKRVD